MFQRLRQMTSHIFMVQEVLEKESGETFTELPYYNDVERAMVAGLRRMIAEKKNRPDGAQGTGMVFTKPKEQTNIPRSKKKPDTLKSKFAKFLKELKRKSDWNELKERSLCSECGNAPEEPYVTSCLHLYCKECLTNRSYDASKKKLDHTACGKCGTCYTESVACKGLKELEIRDLSASVFQKGKDETPSDEKPFKLTMNYVDSKDGLLLSTKTAAVKAQLKRWLEEDPEQKIIVFTEWLMV